jgi:hypothetical protein
MRMHCELSFDDTLPEISSVGQIWTTVCLIKNQKESISVEISRIIGQIWTSIWLIKHQKKSMRMNSTLPLDDFLDRNMLPWSNFVDFS